MQTAPQDYPFTLEAGLRGFFLRMGRVEAYARWHRANAEAWGWHRAPGELEAEAGRFRLTVSRRGRSTDRST